VVEAEGTTRLIGLISEILRMPAAEVVDSIDMEATGTWDSLSHMQLIAAIEEEFAVELTVDEIVEMRSVGQIKNVLRVRSVVA
jgi:acyl carrier protein